MYFASPLNLAVAMVAFIQTTGARYINELALCALGITQCQPSFFFATMSLDRVCHIYSFRLFLSLLLRFLVPLSLSLSYYWVFSSDIPRIIYSLESNATTLFRHCNIRILTEDIIELRVIASEAD